MPLTTIESALRRGLGLAGRVIGTTLKTYRLGGKTGVPNLANSIIDPLNLVLPASKIRLTLQIPKVMQEQEPLYKMMYIGMVDIRRFKVGDIAVETGPHLTDTPDGRVFVLADVQPLLPAVFARVEVFGSISRTYDASGVDEPIVGQGAFQGETKGTEWFLTLNSGIYDLAPTGIPAVIPIGIQPRNRPGDNQEFKYPTATRRGQYVAFIPLLHGFQVQPGDYITDANGNRFHIIVVTAYTVGIQGYQCFVESLLV